MRLIGASRFAPLVLVVLVGKPSQRRFLTPQCCDRRRTTVCHTFRATRTHAPSVYRPTGPASVRVLQPKTLHSVKPGSGSLFFRVLSASVSCCPCIACLHRNSINSIGCVQTSVLGAVAAWTIAGRGRLARAPRGNDEQAKGVCKGKHSETEGRSRGQPCLMMVAMVGELVQMTRTQPVQGQRTAAGSQGVTHGTTAHVDRSAVPSCVSVSP